MQLPSKMDGEDSLTDLGLKLILDSTETTVILSRPSQATSSVLCVVSEAMLFSNLIDGEIQFWLSTQQCVREDIESVVKGFGVPIPRFILRLGFGKKRCQAYTCRMTEIMTAPLTQKMLESRTSENGN